MADKIETLLADALLRCVREIQPHHIPGDVYEQAQAALGAFEEREEARIEDAQRAEDGLRDQHAAFYP